MSCACAHVPDGPTEGIFSVDASALTFGRGAIRELGGLVPSSGRIALFTDPRVVLTPFFDDARRALRGRDVAVYAECAVEPTDASFVRAASFAADGRFDAYVSVGGGSVIDTCKAAVLLATWPAPLSDYLNRPVGAGRLVPGPLPPHVACPTTAGTGSELTGIAVCDVEALRAKSGIASRRLRPTFAVIDPDATATLPAPVVAATGFDVLCHAIESYTARPFDSRAPAGSAADRPMSQGRNPWSDLGSREALRIGATWLRRAVSDAADREAREHLMWAATLAGLAFGNAGVHLPHAMAYAVAGLAPRFVPHGVSVVASAPSAFRFTGSSSPARHLEAASWLGAEVRGATHEDAGELLARALERLMVETQVPVGLPSYGFGPEDEARLVGGTAIQRRLLDNAPCPIHEPDLHRVFRAALA